MSLAAAIPIILKGVVGIAASVVTSKIQSRQEEKAKIAEEARRAARYAGVGEATDIKDPNESSTLADSMNREDRANARVGERPDRVGDRYVDTERRTGVGKRPAIAKLIEESENQSSVSVSQGAVPEIAASLQNDANVDTAQIGQQPTLGAPAQPAIPGQQPAAQPGQPQAPQPRYSYDPQTQRIKINAVPPRPTFAGS